MEMFLLSSLGISIHGQSGNFFFVERMGNRKAALEWEGLLSPEERPQIWTIEQGRKQFLKRKFEEKEFVGVPNVKPAKRTEIFKLSRICSLISKKKKINFFVLIFVEPFFFCFFSFSFLFFLFHLGCFVIPFQMSPPNKKKLLQQQQQQQQEEGEEEEPQPQQQQPQEEEEEEHVELQPEDRVRLMQLLQHPPQQHPPPHEQEEEEEPEQQFDEEEQEHQFQLEEEPERGEEEEQPQPQQQQQQPQEEEEKEKEEEEELLQHPPQQQPQQLQQPQQQQQQQQQVQQVQQQQVQQQQVHQVQQQQVQQQPQQQQQVQQVQQQVQPPKKKLMIRTQKREGENDKEVTRDFLETSSFKFWPHLFELGYESETMRAIAPSNLSLSGVVLVLGPSRVFSVFCFHAVEQLPITFLQLYLNQHSFVKAINVQYPLSTPFFDSLPLLFQIINYPIETKMYLSLLELSSFSVSSVLSPPPLSLSSLSFYNGFSAHVLANVVRSVVRHFTKSFRSRLHFPGISQFHLAYVSEILFPYVCGYPFLAISRSQMLNGGGMITNAQNLYNTHGISIFFSGLRSSLVGIIGGSCLMYCLRRSIIFLNEEDEEKRGLKRKKKKQVTIFELSAAGLGFGAMAWYVTRLFSSRS